MPIGNPNRDWVREFLVEKAHLFLEVLRANEEKGRRDAEGLARLLARHGVSEGSRLLELGCGNGRVAVPLAKLGYHVTCLDVSPVFIEDAARRAKEEGVEDRLETMVGDARRLLDYVGEDEYNAVYMVWTSVLGYYSRDTDLEVLRAARKAVKESGLLVIANTANRDRAVAYRALTGGTDTPYVSEAGRYILIEYPRFDPVSSTVTSRWKFYTRSGRDLIYIDEAEFTIRLYTLTELVEMAREAGWKLEAAYHDLETFRSYIPGLSPFNVVFRTSQDGER